MESIKDFLETNDNFYNESTGSLYSEKTKTILFPLDKYIIKVLVTETNKFIGIKEIAINKDFLSLSQKISSNNFLDIEEFYKEED